MLAFVAFENKPNLKTSQNTIMYITKLKPHKHQTPKSYDLRDRDRDIYIHTRICVFLFIYPNVDSHLNRHIEI